MAPGRSTLKAVIFGVAVDSIDLAEAVRTIISWCCNGSAAYAVTYNVDHAVRLRRDRAFRRAYAEARLVLADGMPIVWASRIGGPSLPERVTGADLVVPLCAAAAKAGVPVVLLGTTLPVLCRAARSLAAHAPGLEIAGAYAPPFDFGADPAAVDEVDAFIRSNLDAARPGLAIVALGAPKQELWALGAIERNLPLGAIVGVGAALDFLAGHRRRAPKLLRQTGLEWLWRLSSEPRRLGGRYTVDLVWLVLLLAGQVAYVLRRPRRRAGPSRSKPAADEG